MVLIQKFYKKFNLQFDCININPNGTNINGTGLEPDVEVELNLEPDEDGYIYDTQLEKAIEVIKTMD